MRDISGSDRALGFAIVWIIAGVMIALLAITALCSRTQEVDKWQGTDTTKSVVTRKSVPNEN